MKQFKKIKVALVHDFLNQWGGAEQVLKELTEIFPEAPIYTLLYEKRNLHGKLAGKDIRTSFLQKFPLFLRKRARFLLPLLPTAPETFNLRDFDLIISSSGAWSKGIVTRLNSIHIAYIHSPMRFVWDYNEKYLKEEHKNRWGFFLRPILSYLRLWDRLAADRPDYLIANSYYTQQRIKKYYRRESQIIYPPVIINEKINPNSLGKAKYSQKYFLIVSRLSAYKNISRVVEAFNKNGLTLIIVGDGKERRKLKAQAKKNIKFTGWVSEAKLDKLYTQARAFIFPGLDDFGMAPVEALQHGIPVLALAKGGAKEFIEAGKNGEFFQTSTVTAIFEAVEKFRKKEKEYDRKYIKKSGKKFNQTRFREAILNLIEEIYKNK